MLFLTKVANCLDAQRGEEDMNAGKEFSVIWLVRRMVREAHHEAIHKVKNSLKVH